MHEAISTMKCSDLKGFKCGLMFGDIVVKKSAFHKSKYPIDINKVNITLTVGAEYSISFSE